MTKPILKGSYIGNGKANRKFTGKNARQLSFMFRLGIIKSIVFYPIPSSNKKGNE